MTSSISIVNVTAQVTVKDDFFTQNFFHFVVCKSKVTAQYLFCSCVITHMSCSVLWFLFFLFFLLLTQFKYIPFLCLYSDDEAVIDRCSASTAFSKSNKLHARHKSPFFSPSVSLSYNHTTTTESRGINHSLIPIYHYQ